ncbi:MAG: hypothetical protein ACXAEN_12380 [Candidatus Thorarchaeota archaeon]|jgi:hypothetical protein
MATIYKLKDGIAQTEREARRERVREYMVKKRIEEREACKEKVEAHHPPGVTCTSSKCWSCAYRSSVDSRDWFERLTKWSWKDLHQNEFRS